MEHKNGSPIYKFPGLEVDTSLFFKKIMENAHMAAIFLLDIDGTILDINLGVRAGFGYTGKDVVGKNFSLLFISRDRKKKKPEMELATVLQKGSASDNNYVLHKDGSYIWCRGESMLTYGMDGEIYVVKIIYDINEQKLMENHLVASQDVYHGVLDTVQNPVLILDQEMKVVDVNSAFCKLFGIVSPEDLYNMPVLVIKDELFNISQFKMALKDVVKKEHEIEGFILEHKFPGLGKRTFSINIRPVSAGSREIRYIIAMNEI